MALEKEQMIILYTNLVRTRKLDEAFVKAFSEGRITGFFHSGQGEEAVAVGACTFLNKNDYIYADFRGHGAAHAVAKGIPPKKILAEHYGKATGMCNGLSGFHISDPDVGIFGISFTIGSAFPVSLGWGLAAKKAGRGQVVVSFFGDGSSNRGTFHEAMNLSAIWKLPIVWLCVNNLYAEFMPIRDAYPREDIADLAGGYGLPGVVVDGQDVVTVHDEVQVAVKKARAGGGPSLLECKTYRYRSHSEGIFDFCHADPRPSEELEAWKKRDPIKLFKERLLTQGILIQDDIDRIDREVTAEIEEAELFAMESPEPDPVILDKALYAD